MLSRFTSTIWLSDYSVSSGLLETCQMIETRNGLRNRERGEECSGCLSHACYTRVTFFLHTSILLNHFVCRGALMKDDVVDWDRSFCSCHNSRSTTDINSRRSMVESYLACYTQNGRLHVGGITAMCKRLMFLWLLMGVWSAFQALVQLARVGPQGVLGSRQMILKLSFTLQTISIGSKHE